MTFQLTKNTSNFLKIIAALMVMLHHYAQYVCSSGLSDSIVYYVLSVQCGYFGVAIFFFLSGYGLMESESKSHLNLSKFIKRRILKVYLPVLLVSCIWLFVSSFLLSQTPFTNYVEIEIGGGNHLIINNILIDFGDGVLWFIKVLVPLYVTFYLYTLIKSFNAGCAFVFIILSTCLTTVLTYHMIGSFACISIPFFTLGVFMSELKETSAVIYLAISVSIVMILLSLVFLNSPKYSVVNILLMTSLILVLFFVKIEFKIPSIFALMTFDLYLIHNKVLMILKGNIDKIDLWLYVSLVMIITISFYFFRTKILRLK